MKEYSELIEAARIIFKNKKNLEDVISEILQRLKLLENKDENEDENEE